MKLLFQSRPELLDEWDSEANGSLPPLDLTSWSKSLSYRWICPQGHSWSATAATRSAGRDCHQCFQKNLGSKIAEVKAEWSPLNRAELVGDSVQLKAAAVWSCRKCGSDWESSLRARLLGLASCPYCSGKWLSRSKLQELQIRWGTELLIWASLTDLGRTWKRTPILWRCSVGHGYLLTLEQRLKGIKCRYCTNRDLLRGFNDVQSQLPELAREWSIAEDGRSPSDVRISERLIVLWICAHGHSWRTTVAHRRFGSGCPSCKAREPRNRRSNSPSRLELEVIDYLRSSYPELELKLNDRHILKGRELDITIAELNVALEVNGEYWHSSISGRFAEESPEQYHRAKREDAALSGFRLGFIWERDWRESRREVKSAIDQFLAGDNPELLNRVISSIDQPTQ